MRSRAHVVSHADKAQPFLFQQVHSWFQRLNGSASSSFVTNVFDTRFLIRLLLHSKIVEEKKTTPITKMDAPPSYDSAALEHGDLPIRTAPPKGAPRPLFPLDIPVLTQLRGKRIILASQSPRRKQILSLVRGSYPRKKRNRLNTP